MSGSVEQPLALSLPLTGRVLVEASAGTGKTYTLVGVVVRLIVEAGLMPDQILVVTYTRAATAELRTRLRDRLGELRRAMLEGTRGSDGFIEALLAASRGDLDARALALARLDAALAGLELAAIDTIHAFCQRALAEGAFRRGAAFEAEVEPLPGSLRRELVNDLWRRATAEQGDAAFWPDAAGPTLARHAATREKLSHWVGVAGRVTAWPNASLVGGERPGDARLDDDAAKASWMLHGRRRLAELVREELPRRIRATGLHDFDGLVRSLRDAIVREPALASELGRRYPALLIDESQDTDALQLEVFDRIHRAAPSARALLVLVGDPKQAIYSFRGADLHSFLRTAATFRDGERHSLLENRRSHPRLVAAADALIARPLARDAPPLRMPKLGYTRPRGVSDTPLVTDPGDDTALTFLLLESDDELSAKDASQAIAVCVADDIVRLLSDSQVQLAGRPLTPADIVVLVDDNQDGAAVRAVLGERGVPTASTVKSSVYASAEARELRILMIGLCARSDERRTRSALAGRIVGLDAAAFERFDQDAAESDRWRRALASWLELWQRDGLGAAVRRICDECGTWTRWSRRRGGERAMTNLLHLLALLDASGIQDPAALLLWFGQQNEDTSAATVEGDDPALLQIDSDGQQVRVMTMHGSKGLEFPIVYLAGIGSGRRQRMQAAPLRQRDDGPEIDIAGTPEAQAAHHSDEVDQAMRVAYVGLTRAKSRAYVVWGVFPHAAQSPLGWWLGEGAAALDLVAMRAAIEALAQTDDAISVRSLPADAGDAAPRRWQPVAARDQAAAPLALASLSHPLPGPDRRASFTALVAQGMSPDEPDHDQAIDDAAVDPAPATAALRFRFERGAAAGVCLHAIAESIDWQAAPRAWHDAIRRELARSAIDGADPEQMAAWFDEIRRAPITVPGTRPFALAGIEQAGWHREVAFDLPLRDADFSRVATAALEAGFAVPALPAQQWRGLLRGYIDALVVRDGRVFVLDWKSNHLGDRFADYDEAAMEAAMRLHGYHLQHLLYSVAVRRFLAARGSPAAFGGVIYAFVRGMSPEAPGHGVVALAPDLALLDTLDALLA